MRMFEGNCASCHAWSGAGNIINAAQLTGARSVNDASATNVLQIILHGSGSWDSGRPYMPSFGAAYSDAEVAAVANYVTARFGSRPSNATPARVATLRQQD
jgi:mono/diheme cytochrome c family protein